MIIILPFFFVALSIFKIIFDTWNTEYFLVFLILENLYLPRYLLRDNKMCYLPSVLFIPRPSFSPRFL